MPIHPTAIVDPSAEIDPTADIGAYAVVEPNVRIGPRVRLYAHTYISSYATLGADCQIHPFAIVGHLPQDLKFTGEPSYTEVGEGTIVREHTSIHRGTTPGSKTVVGRRCFIMSAGHVGHNCTVGDDVIMASGAVLGGHVDVGNRAFISGNVAVHQFVRVGELCMVAGVIALIQDAPPFMTVGRPPYVAGPNVIGLRRAGLSREERQEIRHCYRLVYRSGVPLSKAIAQLGDHIRTEPGRRLLEFLQAPSKRGLLRARRRATASDANEDAA